MKSRLTEQLGDYLTMRRALGYKLERVELLLGQFIAHLVESGTPDMFTINDAIGWATAPQRSSWWHAQRLSAVRGFAAYLHAIDPTVPVPPADLLPASAQRAVPYLYSDTRIPLAGPGVGARGVRGGSPARAEPDQCQAAEVMVTSWPRRRSALT